LIGSAAHAIGSLKDRDGDRERYSFHKDRFTDPVWPKVKQMTLQRIVAKVLKSSEEERERERDVSSTLLAATGNKKNVSTPRGT
jgi:hypothetical protein